jgi:integral membrane protein
MLRTPVGRLRMIGLVEGISFLILLGIAMPLKHFAEMPEAVRIVGWVHGILFIGFLVALMLARDAMRWSFRWTGLVLLAALLPFGPFVIDGRLRKEDEECHLSRQTSEF